VPRIRYRDFGFRKDRLELIEQANTIIREYGLQGFDLTLRQLYYQFVSRDLIENNERSYKRIGNMVNDGRLAGLIDWNAIVDRTRALEALSHWQDAEEIIASCAAQFRLDKWEDQPVRVEVWVEKEALAGVIESACDPLDVPYFSCRGYVSQSEMWKAARRMRDRHTIVLYLGDHDPSGIDMTRDVRDRLTEFGGSVEVKRIALNMDQIQQYSPPPNFAKLSDSRAADYVDQFGTDSWELDALEPKVMVDLITTEVKAVMDERAFADTCELQQEARGDIAAVAENWDMAVDAARTQ